MKYLPHIAAELRLAWGARWTQGQDPGSLWSSVSHSGLVSPNTWGKLRPERPCCWPQQSGGTAVTSPPCFAGRNGRHLLGSEPDAAGPAAGAGAGVGPGAAQGHEETHVHALVAAGLQALGRRAPSWARPGRCWVTPGASAGPASSGSARRSDRDLLMPRSADLAPASPASRMDSSHSGHSGHRSHLAEGLRFLPAP